MLSSSALFSFLHFAELHSHSVFCIWSTILGSILMIDFEMIKVCSAQSVTLIYITTVRKNRGSFFNISFYFQKCISFSIWNSYSETVVGIPTNSTKDSFFWQQSTNLVFPLRKNSYVNFHIFAMFSDCVFSVDKRLCIHTHLK